LWTQENKKESEISLSMALAHHRLSTENKKTDGSNFINIEAIQDAISKKQLEFALQDSEGAQTV
jgi:hypothetical protein